jgi:hypothetical protein
MSKRQIMEVESKPWHISISLMGSSHEVERCTRFDFPFPFSTTI